VDVEIPILEEPAKQIQPQRLRHEKKKGTPDEDADLVQIQKEIQRTNQKPKKTGHSFDGNTIVSIRDSAPRREILRITKKNVGVVNAKKAIVPKPSDENTK
jgi:hypothetical protein